MISLRGFRILVGSIVLIAHFAAIILMATFSLWFALPVRDLIGNVVAITPVAAVYSVMYYKYITANPNELESEKGKTIGKASSLTQSGVIGLFSLILVLSPIYFFLGSGVIADANIFVGGLETVFGAFIARTFGLLFPSEILGEAMIGDARGDPKKESVAPNPAAPPKDQTNPPKV